MEVRLSEFAEIVGTTTATIRNAIQLNKLPFLESHVRTAENNEKVSRRTYSVEDAFGWFLHEEISHLLGLGRWQSAGLVQACWRRGLRIYARERMEGVPSDDSYLIVGSKLPAKDGSRALLEIVLPRFSPRDQADNFLPLIADYPIISFVQLDPIFHRFVAVLAQRGWAITKEGFAKLETREA